MAPRKEKVDKAPADQAADMILTYLRKQNRPYSANDISANLHNKVTKTAAAKYLKDMHERKEIEGRVSGKQIVYHCIQDPPDAATPEALACLSATIATIRSTTASLNTTVKDLRTQLSALSTTLSTSDLMTSISSLEAEKIELLAQLKPLREGNVKKVDEKQKVELEREYVKWTGVVVRRRKISEELWGIVRDGMPEGVGEGEVRESLGLDES